MMGGLYGRIWPLASPNAQSILARVLLLGFSSNFSMVYLLLSPHYSAVATGPILIGFLSFEGHDERPPWSYLSVGIQKLLPAFSCFVFPDFFLYAVVHMVPPLLSGRIMDDAPLRPIILGVIMTAAMVRCLADAAVAPKIR